MAHCLAGRVKRSSDHHDSKLTRGGRTPVPSSHFGARAARSTEPHVSLLTQNFQLHQDDMSDSLFSELCYNLCMMKPLTRGGGCRGCCGGNYDDKVLEEVEREQRESRRQTTQPLDHKPMTTSNGNDGHDDPGHDSERLSNADKNVRTSSS